MLVVTKPLRQILKKPFGKVLTGESLLAEIENKTIHAIGDSTLLFLLENKIAPKSAAYDFKCMRKDLSTDERGKISKGVLGMRQVSVKNPAGVITDDMGEEVGRAVREGGAIFVDGEEDLAALIAMAKAADGELILYGQPKKGVVLIVGSEKTRKRAEKLLLQMERK